jgi:hypothetical protein
MNRFEYDFFNDFISSNFEFFVSMQESDISIKNKKIFSLQAYWTAGIYLSAFADTSATEDDFYCV